MIHSDKRHCNKCGKELDFWDLQEDFSINKHIGYGSIYDLHVIDLHLCCNCMDELIGSCKISPIEGEYELYSDINNT